MHGEKHILCGIAVILFGILLEIMNAYHIWLPIIGEIPCHIIGLIVGIIGIAVAIRGCCKRD